MKFTIKEFFNKCDQIYSFLQIWSHLRQKPLIQSFISVQCDFELVVHVNQEFTVSLNMFLDYLG